MRLLDNLHTTYTQWLLFFQEIHIERKHFFQKLREQAERLGTVFRALDQ